jgi:hypothetical protein
MDIKADTISARMDTNGHEWTPRVDTSYIRSPNGHEWTLFSCPFVSNDGPARTQISKGFARWLPGAMWLINQVKAAGMWSEAVLWFWLDVVQFIPLAFSPARVATWRAFEVPWGHVSPLMVK